MPACFIASSEPSTTSVERSRPRTTGFAALYSKRIGRKTCRIVAIDV